MRAIHASTLAAALLLFFASSSTPAAAAPMPFNGSLRVAIGTLTPITVTGSGTADVSAGGGFMFPAGVFTIATSATVTAGFISRVAIAGSAAPHPTASGQFTPAGVATNGSGSFSLAGGFSGGFGGLMSLNGVGFARAFGVWIPIPISPIGAGGTGMGGVFGITITITGTGWTTGSVSMPTILTPMGVFMGTTSTAGFDNRTASGLGSIQLVTPVVINTNLTSLGFGFIPAFGVMRLTFVPEPAPALLAGVAVLGVVALRAKGRRRGR